jgi:hypothetical protein
MGSDSFGATAFFVWKINRPYRIYTRDGRVFFIRRQPSVDPQRAALVGLQFGVVGGLVMALRGFATAKQLALLVTDDDPTPPDQLLGKNPENFVLPSSRLAQSHIEGPGKLTSFGPHVDRWHCVGPDGKDLVLLFEQVSDMKVAIERLTALLGKGLRVNAAWDEKAKKFRAAA